MATPQHSGSALLRATKLTAKDNSSHPPAALVQGEGSAEQVLSAAPDAKQNDHALNAAVIEAAEHPERAAALAEELGIGSTAERESVLHQALRGEAFPPPISDSCWDAPPAGAFDGGVNRVMGEDELFRFTKGDLSLGRQPWKTSETNRVEDVRLQVTNSYGFARYAGLLATAINEAEQTRLTDAEFLLSQMTAVVFLAGWIMAFEHQDAKRSARGHKGTVPELVDLFRHKVDFRGIGEDAFSDYWTPEQIKRAKGIMRHEDEPELYSADGTWIDGVTTAAEPEDDSCTPPVEVQLLKALGSRDEDDFLPELLPVPQSVSQCDDGSAAASYMPDCFAMVVTGDYYDQANGRGWKIRRGDVLIFNVDGVEIGGPRDVFLASEGGQLTLVDSEIRSLRDGSELVRASVICPAVQYRPIGQIGGGQ